MKANPDKYHLLLNNSCKKTPKIENFETEISTQVIRNYNDNNLKFASHVEHLCKNGSRKMHGSLHSLHELNKETITIKCVFVSQFSYCPLAWMCLQEL